MATADFIVGIPVANTLKFTRDDLPKDYRANFDQQSFSEAIHASTQQRDFHQPLEKADPVRVGLYSNWPAIKLETILIEPGKQTVKATYTPSLVTNYQNKKYRSACNFYTINGKLFIYFTSGPEYSDEDFLVPGNVVNLDGRKPPIAAKVGDQLRFQIGSDPFQFSTIQEIAWSPELSAQGYLTNINFTVTTPVPGLVEVTYDQKPYNFFAQLLDNTSLEDGCYRFKLSFGVRNTSWLFSFTSEPVYIQDKHENSLAIIYRHDGIYSKKEIWNFEYQDDWTNIIRMPAEFFKFEPAGEVDQYMNDAGIPDMLRAIPYRQMIFTAFHIPSWLVDKFNVIFSHDSKQINDYHWVNDNFGSDDRIDRTDITVFSITLRQKEDRTLFGSEFTAEVTASFDPPTHTNIAFGGTVVSSIFHSNTGSTFKFQSIPSWIHPDKETFVDGDTINFTIDANAVLFERIESLTAVTEDFDVLTAAVSFHQLYDTSTPPPPVYIEASPTSVTLAYTSGSNQAVSVNASGDYTITPSGSFTFSAVKESGGIVVRISSPSANGTSFPRTGTIRLALVSNPTVFVDISVTQEATPDLMISISPSSIEAPVSGAGTRVLFVDVVAGTQWQASSSHSWAQVQSPSTIYTGPQFIDVYIEDLPEYINSRNAGVTAFNIANPSDSVSMSIFQFRT